MGHQKDLAVIFLIVSLLGTLTQTQDLGEGVFKTQVALFYSGFFNYFNISNPDQIINCMTEESAQAHMTTWHLTYQTVEAYVSNDQEKTQRYYNELENAHAATDDSSCIYSKYDFGRLANKGLRVNLNNILDVINKDILVHPHIWREGLIPVDKHLLDEEYYQAGVVAGSLFRNVFENLNNQISMGHQVSQFYELFFGTYAIEKGSKSDLESFYSGLFNSVGQTLQDSLPDCLDDQTAYLVLKRFITQYLYDRSLLNLNSEGGEDEVKYLKSVLDGLKQATTETYQCLENYQKVFFLDGLNRNIQNVDELIETYKENNHRSWVDGYLKIYKLMISQDFFYAGLVYGNLLRDTIFAIEQSMEDGKARLYYEPFWASSSKENSKNRFLLFAVGFLEDFDLKPPYISIDCFDNDQAFEYFRMLQTEYFYVKAIAEKNKEEIDKLRPIYKKLYSSLERNLYCFYESDQYKQAIRELTRRNIDILPLILRASERDPGVWTVLTRPAHDLLKDGRYYEAGQAIAKRTKDVLPKLAIGTNTDL